MSPLRLSQRLRQRLQGGSERVGRQGIEVELDEERGALLLDRVRADLGREVRAHQDGLDNPGAGRTGGGTMEEHGMRQAGGEGRDAGGADPFVSASGSGSSR